MRTGGRLLSGAVNFFSDVIMVHGGYFYCCYYFSLYLEGPHVQHSSRLATQGHLLVR